MCQQKLNRLKQIIKEREKWRESLEEVEDMLQWVLDAESLLDGSWAEQHESGVRTAPAVTNEEVSLRFDGWRTELTRVLDKQTQLR